MHGHMALGGIQLLGMHRGHHYYGLWVRGRVWIILNIPADACGRSGDHTGAPRYAMAM